MSFPASFARSFSGRPRWIGLLLAGLAVAAWSCPEYALSAEQSTSIGLADRVQEHRLANGMKVLMVERHQAPIVSINLIYRVGAVDEKSGQTGLAHLFEHMAFKGTKTLGTTDYKKERKVLRELEEVEQALRERRHRKERTDPEEIEKLERRFEALQQDAQRYAVNNAIGELYDRHGAVGLNAGTGNDYTQYIVSLPANRLPLWAAVESDRMANTVLREFYKERDVVLEERRMRVDNRPSGQIYEAFLSAAFQAHPYRDPVIGWASDVASLTPFEAREFFGTYYVPENAVLVVVGDIVPKEVLKLVRQTFGRLPKKDLPVTDVTEEPPQRGERRVQIEYDANPQMVIGYHMPAIGHGDAYVLDAIDSLLSLGRTSRLYTRLIKERQSALNVSTSIHVPGARYPGLFVISAVPRLPHTTAELEETIYEELERLKKEPVEERELTRVLNQLDAYLVRSLSSNSGLAGQLAYFETVAGDWRYLLQAREKIAEITPEDVMRVAGKYFTRQNRTVATLVKKEAGDQ